MFSSQDGPELQPAAAVLLTGLLSAWSPVVVANDATFGGRGSDLLPLQETRVRMVSEDIVLELVPVRDAWQVTATYVFENPTDQAIKLQMGFPEERCREDQDCTPNAGLFQDLVTTVRGVPVEQREGRVSRAEWAEQLGRVFLYDVTFAPRERVEIVHTYAYDRSTGVDWWGTTYLTRTGGLWGGPIGHARFTVRLREPVLYVIYPNVFALTRFAEEPSEAGGAKVELVFEARDWRPTVDFSVSFPSFSIVAMTDEGLCQGIEGDLSDEELAPVLASWSDRQLRACRNRLYSLHGYPFKDPALRAEAYGPPALPDWADPEVFAIAPRPENPAFSPALLSAGERGWIDAIAAEEKRRGLR